MTIGAHTKEKERVKKSFRDLKKLFLEINGRLTKEQQMTELSMGMSSDFLLAIKEGATMVRLGTSIFGERKERLNSMKLEFSKSSSDNCFFESYRVSKNDNKSSIEIFAKSNLQITADFSYLCLFNNSSS